VLCCAYLFLSYCFPFSALSSHPYPPSIPCLLFSYSSALLICCYFSAACLPFLLLKFLLFHIFLPSVSFPA
jgi:hypothetical protein